MSVPVRIESDALGRPPDLAAQVCELVATLAKALLTARRLLAATEAVRLARDRGLA